MEEGFETGVTRSSHHQAGPAPSIVLKEGIFINIFLERNIVWREIVPTAVQVNRNSEGEPGLSTEFSDWSRLLRQVLKSFTGTSLNIPCLSEAYL